MEKNQIRHQCGYCGWHFCLTTNFFDHKCFKHYVEGVDQISVDENYVVTILDDKEGDVAGNCISKDTLDELLIGAIKARPALYDLRLPASKRTNLCKNALWAEVSNILGGALNPDAAKVRWKYLRDNYVKARKKERSYVPSGSAATASAEKKSKFKFYNLMTFLNDSLETRQTVCSLPNPESEKDNTVGSFRDHNVIAPGTLSPTQPSPRKSAPIDISRSAPRFSKSPSSSSGESCAAHSSSLKRYPSSFDYDIELPQQGNAAKRQNKTEALQTAILELLNKPIAQPTTKPMDSVDSLLARLGAGLRALPDSEKRRLEVRFITLLTEAEDRCAAMLDE